MNIVKKAIERAMVFGEHGLPLIGRGDWNDGMNNIGPKGNGESVWLGFFMYDVLNKYLDVLKTNGRRRYNYTIQANNERPKESTKYRRMGRCLV